MAIKLPFELLGRQTLPGLANIANIDIRSRQLGLQGQQLGIQRDRLGLEQQRIQQQALQGHLQRQLQQQQLAQQQQEMQRRNLMQQEALRQSQQRDIMQRQLGQQELEQKQQQFDIEAELAKQKMEQQNIYQMAGLEFKRGQADRTRKEQKEFADAIRSGDMMKAQTINPKGFMDYQKSQLSVMKDQTQQENKLRSEFIQQTKGFIDVRDSYERVKSVAQNPSPAGDIALIFNYMKMLDPGSVIRESEFATAENAGSVPTKVRATYNKILKGERLTSTQRKDFMNQANNLFKSQSKGYNTTKSNYKKLAKNYNLNENNVILELDENGDVKPTIKKLVYNPQTGRIE